MPYTLGPMPQFPRQPQLLMRAVVSDSVAHSSGSVCPTDMLHRAAVLARDRSSLSVSCEPAFLQALFVQTDIDPGSPRESAVACLAKSGRVRRTRTATHGAMLRRALIKWRPTSKLAREIDRDRAAVSVFVGQSNIPRRQGALLASANGAATRLTA